LVTLYEAIQPVVIGEEFKKAFILPESVASATLT